MFPIERHTKGIGSGSANTFAFPAVVIVNLPRVGAQYARAPRKDSSNLARTSAKTAG
jgi:hypothetical protein